MLRIDHVTFAYGRRSKPVLSDFTLGIDAGRIYGLLGKNGTGKSTLLGLMCGLLFPQRGSVSFDGVSVGARQPQTLEDIFLVPEEFELPNLTIRRYVALRAPFYPRFSERVMQECLADFGLTDTMRLASLSMGQKKKALVSFALAARTRLLLMDEPTNGLDIPSKSLFRKVVSRQMDDDRAIVISTHQVADVEMLIDHVLLVEGSRLLLDRSAADICAALRFEERTMGQPLDDALYVQPSMGGHSVIVPNDRGGDETPLNLEMLFNCAEAGKLPAALTDTAQHTQP